MPKALSIDKPLDGNLKPVKDSDGTMSAIELSTGKVRVKDLDILGEAKGQTPTTEDGLATKGYVDGNQGSIYYWNLNAGFNYGSTAGTKVYVPLNGYIFESSSSSARNEYQVVIIPHDGYLSKVVVRSEEACGATTVGLHISANTTEIPNTTASHSVAIAMLADDISYNFTFGDSATVSSGDVIAISFDPQQDANDTIITAVFILDGST
tara:strand:- start:69 stop:695 length:627 start_codon:yes stop_codon:yes gene_type:complete